ncbi:MAG: hypothetical protein ISR58_19375 [Anaerolineales bacterium]|nr:hypothetical protein [Chloroflexota bacterium]MBL6983345.1 hypothetical protein [Anaerolineales bacterium]
MSSPSTIGGINLLPMAEKRRIYTRIIPPEIFDRFHLNPYLTDLEGRDLLLLNCPEGSSSAEISLYHKFDFEDPILYGHITDTLNGQLHILLYNLNNPDAPRFDVDRLPDGTPTKFGTRFRNIEAELAAMNAGLSPGQIREGLHLLKGATNTFESFVESAGHTIYFAEPLYYHNAVIFERYGFTYQQGRRRMESYHQRFSPGGDLLPKLDSSTEFRQPIAADSIRLRSWAIHDGILGESFTNVTMYKTIGKHAGVNTCPAIPW